MTPMPTGYTAKLYDGTPQTFKEFALDCAKAFGACISLRDDPVGTPIPDEFLPDTYHADALTRAQLRLAQIERMSDLQVEDKIQEEFADAFERRLTVIAEQERRMRQYGEMFTRVVAWPPPTTTHQGLKDFMIQQITDSIDHDCWSDDELGRYYPMPVAPTIDEWRTQAKADAWQDVHYHREHNVAEIARTNERSNWVRALRESL